MARTERTQRLAGRRHRPGRLRPGGRRLGRRAASCRARRPSRGGSTVQRPWWRRAPAVKPGSPRTAGKGGTPPKAGDNPSWNKLSRAQQEALQPLAGEWNKLEALRKQKWLDIASRFASMTADEQTRVHERMREWVKLTPEQRRLVRENYTRTKKIDPGQKTAQWEQYQQLPEDQKKKLATELVPKKPLGKVPAINSTTSKPAAVLAPATPAAPAAAAPLACSRSGSRAGS